MAQSSGCAQTDMANAFFQQLSNATRYSLDGLSFLLKSEFAARIELYFFLWVFPFLIFFELSIEYLLSTVILFLFLLAVEALNTAVEVIVDRVSPEISPMGKQAKDLGSFAVMCVLIVNILHLAFVISKLNFAKFEWGKTLFVSVALLGLGLFLAVSKTKRKRRKVVILAIVGSYLLATAAYLASDYFTGVGFDSKVVYHLRTGLEGAGFGEYKNLIIWMSLYSIAGVGLTYFLADLFGKKTFKFSKAIERFRFKNVTMGRGERETHIETPGKNTLRNILAGAVLTVAVLLNPFSQDVSEFIRTERISIKKISDYEFYAQPENLTLSNKKNLVFVYLESLERTYFDTEIFPGLVPNLSRLEKENIYFTDVQYAYHTEWTIAGMLGSQCGVPLYTSSNGNAMDAYDEFMPNALCMGDILKNNGYDLTYLNGGDAKFAGKESFYASHGFDVILGKEDHEKNPDYNGFYSRWGLYDDKLFDLAFDKFTRKSKSRDPFGLFVLTLDTHHPKGHMPPVCDGVKYQDGSNEMLNAVKCSDRLAADFIEQLRNSPYAKDTLIVVMSDHMAMQNQAISLLDKGTRRNFFMIIDPENSAPMEITRPTSALDIGPTVLSLLGFQEQSLGFGRNLFGEEKTLFEEKGEMANPFLISMRNIMQAELWEFPTLEKGAAFDFKNKVLKIDKRSLAAPVFLTLEGTNIKDIRFFIPGSPEKEKFLETGIVNQVDYLWFDKCEVMNRYLSEGAMGDKASDPNQLCSVSKVGGVISKNLLDQSMTILPPL